MDATITFARRFCGPPESANGGYSAGAVAEVFDGPAEVTLRRPPPLERPLVRRTTDGRVELLDGDVLVAEATPATVDLDLVPPVPFTDACTASEQSPMRDGGIHPFPTCYACGPARTEHDGLRLFAGRVPGTDTFATPWTPFEIDARVVWAALDCPSSVVIYLDDDHPPPHVLGRIAARIDRLPAVGARHVIMSWLLGVDGRKVHSASAIYDERGACCAVARATWIRLQTSA